MANAFDVNAFDFYAFDTDGGWAVTINGVDRTRSLRQGQIDISGLLNQEPDTCHFVTRANSFAPVAGNSIVVEYYGATLFAGQVTLVEQTADSVESNIIYRCDCTDWQRLFNRRLVIGKFSGSASTVAPALVTAFASGFTTANVAASLASVTLDFKGTETLGDAMDAICQQIGGYWYIDEGRDLHLFTADESTNLPSVVTNTNMIGLPSIKSDVSQLRTRVVIMGKSTSASAAVPTTATIVPILDATAFASSGSNKAWSKDQVFSYTGKNPGGASTNIASIGGPTGTPVVSLASGTIGGVVGTVSYKVSFKNSAGETAPGPVSGSVTGAAFGAPSSPSLMDGIAFGTTLGLLGTGTYGYRVTFVTAKGETTPGASATIALPALVPTGSVSASTTSFDGGLTVGATYHYAYSVVLADGSESALSSATTYTAQASTDTPTSPGGTFVSGGSLSPSSFYGWAVSFIDRYGKETPLSTTATGTTGTTNLALSMSIQTSTEPHITGRRIYRTRAGGGTLYLLAEINDNVTTAFLDQAPDSTLKQAAPTSVTMSKPVNLSPPSISSFYTNAVAIKVYRTQAGGSTYFYLTTTTTLNGTFTYKDALDDRDLTVQAPTTSNVGRSVVVQSIPTGPTGTLARRVYRTAVGSSAYRLLAEIQDNTTTTLTDTTADAALGSQGPPLTNTAGASAVSLTSIPTGSSAITSRRLYRSDDSGLTYRFVAEIPDNSTTSYTDSLATTELGDLAPTSGTIGALRSDTTLNVASTTDLPSAGWARANGNLISWTGKTSTSLTGIPPTGTPGGTPQVNGNHAQGATSVVLKGLAAAGTYKANDRVIFAGDGTLYTVQANVTADGSGNVTITISPGLAGALANNTSVSLSSAVGSITANLSADTPVIAEPMLTGVSGLAYALGDGDPIRLYVQVDDTTKQAAVAAAEGGDGIHVFPVDDDTLDIPGATAVGNAHLTIDGQARVTVEFSTRDVNMRAGKPVTFNLTAPTSYSGTLKIQTVDIQRLGSSRDVAPLRRVTASNARFSFEQLVRDVLAGNP